MAFNHRSSLLSRKIEEDTTSTSCYFFSFPRCVPPLPPPPPPPPPPPQNQHIAPLVIIIIAVLGSCFLLVTYYVILVKYCSSWTRSRRTPPQSDGTHEDFLDENHGPVVDHPIWFINTVGLEQSIINAITVCKYKRGDGLVEGTECSVCLNEFQEDETLRLLPKCSHAFHLPCIDAWLRSHTNCPMCRAHIFVSNHVGSSLSETGPNLSNSGLGDEIRVENSEGDGGLGGDRSGESAVRLDDERELQDGRRDVEIAKEGIPSPIENWVLDDFADNQETVVEDGIQPMRRSVSMDSSSMASMFCFSLANFLPVESEGSSAAHIVRGKKSNLGIIAKHSGGSPSILRLMRSCSSSKGKSLQKGPVSMKRSFSSGGKSLSSRYSENRNSILPL